MGKIQIHQLKIINFDAKKSIAEIEVYFTDNGSPDKISRVFELKQPEKILNQIFLYVKSKNRIQFDDPKLSPVELLERYTPVLVMNEEQTEEKIFNFLRNVCDKARRIKTIKDAKEHMLAIDQIKTAVPTLDIPEDAPAGNNQGLIRYLITGPTP